MIGPHSSSRVRPLACRRAVLVFNHPSYVDAAGAQCQCIAIAAGCCSCLPACLHHPSARSFGAAMVVDPCCGGPATCACLPSTYMAGCDMALRRGEVLTYMQRMNMQAPQPNPTNPFPPSINPNPHAVMATFFTPSGVSKAGVASIPFIGLFGVALQVCTLRLHASL